MGTKAKKQPKKKITYPYKLDPKKRKLAQIYSRKRMIQFVAGQAISVVILLLFLFSGFSIFLQGFAESISLAFSIPIYIFLFITIMTVITLPLAFYSGYIFEHKYGLSNYSVRGWFKDFFKEMLVGYILSIVLMSSLYLIMAFSPLNWWIYAGILYFGFLLLMNHLYPILVVPFFYKMEPYKDAKMKKKLLDIVEKSGMGHVKRVMVVKESEKSNKPNAFFAGMGNTKSICLYDTLLDAFTPDEIETVVGHEAGHYVHHDIWKGLIADFIKVFPVLFLVNIVLVAGAPYFGIPVFSDIATLPLFMLAYTWIGFFFNIVIVSHSRKMEAAADWFALETVRKPDAQMSTERRLADMALAVLKPHKLVETILHTHPNTQSRIDMAAEWKRLNTKKKGSYKTRKNKRSKN